MDASIFVEPPSKRTRSTIESGLIVTDVDRPPAKNNILTSHELQAIEYVNEIISHGVRSFATGWLLEDTIMSL